MTPGDRTDPYRSFRFRIEIDGLTVGGFSEVTGLHREVDTEDYVEGGVNGFTHKLARGFKFPNLVLKHGITDADGLWKWQNSVGQRKPRIDRKSIRICLLDSEGHEKVSWRCLRAYPVRWTGPDLRADANSVALESLELAHCGIERL